MLGRSDGLVHSHTIDSGWIMLSDGPGLGIEFDVARIHHLAARQLGGRASAGLWGRRRGAGLIEIPFEQVEELGEE